MAWLVIAMAGLLGSAGLFYLTRGIGNASLRWIFRVTPLLLMVAPAPVPNYDGQLAPAFVVLIFESLFQSEGEPVISALILLAAMLIAVAVGLLLGRIAPSAAPETASGESG